MKYVFNCRLNLKNKKFIGSKEKISEMSDEEFAQPSGANNRWHQTNVNKIINPNAGGLFRWKRGSPSNTPDQSVQNDQKRQKLSNTDSKKSSEIESIDVTDDEDDEVIKVSDDSDNCESPIKPVLVSPRKIELEEIENESPRINLSPMKFLPKYKNVPIPPGMPPVIAGVPVKFPITPYKSQISVMNAVSHLIFL